VILVKMLQRCLYIPETTSFSNDHLATRSRLMFARYLIDPRVRSSKKGLFQRGYSTYERLSEYRAFKLL
jgi:hypothetical protein